MSGQLHTHERAGSQNCPFCHGALTASEIAWECPRCHTRHHGDCARDNGGCTLFGCGAPFAAQVRGAAGCATCRAPLGPQEAAWECPGCHARHHQGCAREGDPCTLIHCGEVLRAVGLPSAVPGVAIREELVVHASPARPRQETGLVAIAFGLSVVVTALLVSVAPQSPRARPRRPQPIVTSPHPAYVRTIEDEITWLLQEEPGQSPILGNHAGHVDTARASYAVLVNGRDPAAIRAQIRRDMEPLLKKYEPAHVESVLRDAWGD